MLLLAFQFFGDQLIEPGPGMASGNRQGVSDRPIIRAAVAHDANAINAQKRRSAQLSVVVFLGEIGQGVDGFIPLDRKAFTNFSGNHFRMNSVMPSQTLRITFPENPSQMTTSTVPLWMSRPSTFPL